MSNTSQEWRSGTPEDQQELRDLVMLYCRGIDRRDMEILRAIFHPDAKLDYGADFYRGDFEPWLEMVPQGMQQFGLTQHHVTNSLFRFDGDIAIGETYLVAYHTLHTPEPGMFIAGARYLDRFERREGRWRISERVAIQDWQIPAGQITTVPLGTLTRDDASYKLFGNLKLG